MINDKKIETAKEEMFYEGDIKEAIGLGAKWAINELFKNLWHSALGSTKNAITLGNILYVHQLQHLLFGLELNSEMEV